MRTRALVLAAVVGSLALATSALAAMVDGTPGDDRMSGTPNADVIRAFDGNDLIGACIGFCSPPALGSLHSHIAGVAVPELAWLFGVLLVVAAGLLGLEWLRG